MTAFSHLTSRVLTGKSHGSIPSTLPFIFYSANFCIFVDTNVVVLAFTHLVRFDLGRKMLEGNRTLCREGDASIAMIPTIHGL